MPVYRVAARPLVPPGSREATLCRNLQQQVSSSVRKGPLESGGGRGLASWRAGRKPQRARDFTLANALAS
jgi:hypothetical protein